MVKSRKIRLPMERWQEIARRLEADAVCELLVLFGADKRTWSALASWAIRRWHEREAALRKEFGGVHTPRMSRWAELAHLMALQGVPLAPDIVQDLRCVLIETGSVHDLFELDGMYGKPATGSEIERLAAALDRCHRYDWQQWGELVEFTGHRYPRDLAKLVADKKAEAHRDYNFDG
ncbi:MAG TPA: hypothetical protein VMJ72_00220 [Candidatus Paceibacterota bacterium]|nr:hypothetical protein [Candidatus Paceibacterota bacterium]